MSKRVSFGILTFLFSFTWMAHADAKKDLEARKAALQALQEFIGPWDGTGEVKSGKAMNYKEKMNWGWKFKGEESWLAVEYTDSKQFTKGDLKYLVDKKQYQFTVIDKNEKELVFDGELKKKKLTLSRVDPDSKDKQIITMSTNNEGLRLIYQYSVQTKGKGIEKVVYEVAHKKEGTSLGSSKKNECIVTGGLGTMQVSYMGKTYFVCCSGCRDAFNEDPKKFVDEFEKKKK